MKAPLKQSLKSWLEAGLAFFYPEVCQICGAERATAAEGFVGTQCWQTVRFVVPPWCERCGLPYEGDLTTTFECSNCRELELDFRQARAAVIARGVVRDVIHRYKYRNAPWFEAFLADLLVRQAAPNLRQETWNLIVPVPLHSSRQREREFNQAGRLASRLGAAIGVPVNEKLLQRVQPTRTQTKLTRVERARNVRHAFDLVPGARLNGERVIVVDDVLTTGATTSACARVLRAAGAADVCVWTVARGL